MPGGGGARQHRQLVACGAALAKGLRPAGGGGWRFAVVEDHSNIDARHPPTHPLRVEPSLAAAATKLPRTWKAPLAFADSSDVGAHGSSCGGEPAAGPHNVALGSVRAAQQGERE